MSNAFRNYTDLASALEQANDTKNQAVVALEEAKEKGQLVGKTLGDLKGAVSGRSALQKVWKNTIKPKVREKLDKVAKEKLQQLENKFKRGTADNSNDDGVPSNDTGSAGVENEPTTTVDLANGEDEPPSYDDLLARSTQATEDRFNQIFGDTPEARGSAFSDSDARALMDKGLNRVAEFEKRVASGDAEGDETISLSRNPDGSLTRFKNRKIDFEDEDLGNEGDNVYSRANGLTDDEISTLQNWWGAKNDATGSDELANLQQNFGSRVGNFRSAVSSIRQNNLKPIQPSADSEIPDATTSSEPDLLSTAKSAVKTAVEKGAGKLGEETAGEVAGEAGAGVLDAIPGLDILGFLGGAILAGVEEHKMHKEERLEAQQEGEGSAMTIQEQAGIGDN